MLKPMTRLFIAGRPSLLALYDFDHDQDLTNHTEATIRFGEGGPPWPSGKVALIPEDDPVLALVEVNPPRESWGFFARLWALLGFGNRSGSGSLSGNLHPPGGLESETDDVLIVPTTVEVIDLPF